MSLNIDLSGKRALVTGGSRGIGRAVVEQLLAAGAEVGFSFKNLTPEVQAFVEATGQKGQSIHEFQCDLEADNACEHLVNEFEAKVGDIDILVANAGIWEGAPLADLDSKTLARTLKINVDGVVQIVRFASRSMKRNGWGRVVAIGSTAGQRGEAEYSQYAASKGAVHLFVKSVAVELAPFGINVNTVAPGWVKTDMVESAMADGGEEIIAGLIPRGKVASASDIAGPVLFLCSPLADHIVGATISVNGGSVLD